MQRWVIWERNAIESYPPNTYTIDTVLPNATQCCQVQSNWWVVYGLECMLYWPAEQAIHYQANANPAHQHSTVHECSRHPTQPVHASWCNMNPICSLQSIRHSTWILHCSPALVSIRTCIGWWGDHAYGMVLVLADGETTPMVWYW